MNTRELVASLVAMGVIASTVPSQSDINFDGKEPIKQQYLDSKKETPSK